MTTNSDSSVHSFPRCTARNYRAADVCRGCCVDSVITALLTCKYFHSKPNKVGIPMVTKKIMHAVALRSCVQLPSFSRHNAWIFIIWPRSHCAIGNSNAVLFLQFGLPFTLNRSFLKTVFKQKELEYAGFSFKWKKQTRSLSLAQIITLQDF